MEIVGRGLPEGGHVIAVLVPEPENSHDRNAVRIDVLLESMHYTVGYLSRDIAASYQAVLLPELQRGRYGMVRADYWRGHSTTQVYLRLGDPGSILPPKLPVENGVFIGGIRSVTVTGEEDHQDVLNAAIGRNEVLVDVFSLGFCDIVKGKYAGARAIEVVYAGQRVGQLTRAMSERYEPRVTRIIDEGGMAFSEGVVQRSGDRGLQVELMMP